MLPTLILQASISLQTFVEIKTHPYNRKVFQRLAVITMSRTVDLRDILTYELGPVPLKLTLQSMIHPLQGTRVAALSVT